MNKLNIGPAPWSITWKREAPYTFCPKAEINDAAGHFTGITVDSISDAYLHDGGELDARRTAMGYVATAAPEMLAALEDALKTAEFERHPYRPWQADARRAIAQAKGLYWAVGHDPENVSGSTPPPAVSYYATQEDAEAAIATIEKVDPEGVHRGDYFIDGPGV